MFICLYFYVETNWASLNAKSMRPKFIEQDFYKVSTYHLTYDYKDKNGNFTMDKSGWYYPTKLIKFYITNNGTNWHHMPIDVL